MHPKAKGEKTEAIVLAELIKRDYKVLIPYGDNQRYDFVIDMGVRFIRLQCKTARFKNGAVKADIKRTQSNARKCTSTTYGINEIDYFILYCYELDKVYIIPCNKSRQSSISLRVNNCKNKQLKGIKFAQNYELDNWSVAQESERLPYK